MKKQYIIELRGTNPKTGVTNAVRLDGVYNYQEMLFTKKRLNETKDAILISKTTNKLEVVVIETTKEVK
jgi:hypothetical protein